MSALMKIALYGAAAVAAIVAGALARDDAFGIHMFIVAVACIMALGVTAKQADLSFADRPTDTAAYLDGVIRWGVLATLFWGIAGFLVGVIENLAGTYVPFIGTELKLTVALGLIIGVLLVRPSGLFGRPHVHRV